MSYCVNVSPYHASLFRLVVMCCLYSSNLYFKCSFQRLWDFSEKHYYIHVNANFSYILFVSILYSLHSFVMAEPDEHLLLKQLHWLPVNYRIKFKLCTLTFRALAIHQPPYLASLLHFSNIPRQLRSSTSQQLSIPRTKLNLGKRAFSVAAPIIWNELPTTLKSCESLASFRKNLKTYLFKIAFPP